VILCNLQKVSREKHKHPQKNKEHFCGRSSAAPCSTILHTVATRICPSYICVDAFLNEAKNRAQKGGRKDFAKADGKKAGSQSMRCQM
jgi:hypothetical protein